MPIWLGQPSSIAKRVLERMDAFLEETDDAKRMPAAGKVAVVAVVGNEDGAHHCHAASFQALNDVGFTIPANAGAYWVGEAMKSVNYVDLKKVPKEVNATLEMLASNSTHLARILKAATTPACQVRDLPTASKRVLAALLDELSIALLRKSSLRSKITLDRAPTRLRCARERNDPKAPAFPDLCDAATGGAIIKRWHATIRYLDAHQLRRAGPSAYRLGRDPRGLDHPP